MPPLKDLTGQVFGRLTVLERAENRGKRVYWRCRCTCGNEVEVRTDSLTSVDNRTHKATRSCGCLAKDHAKEIGHENKGKLLTDLIGVTNGKLTVLELTEDRTSWGAPIWKCKCSCGNICYKNSNYIKKSKYANCGCETRSNGELLVRDILDENNINYIEQKTFDNCRYENNYPAWFDFYLPDINTIIEYDGQQHFGYKDDNGWNTKEHFEKVKKQDAIKNQYCFDHNIKLIRIPYARFNLLCLDDLLPATSQFLMKATE